MSDTPRTIFSELAANCAAELLNSYGAQAVRSAAVSANLEGIAVIGYASDEMRGSLGLAVNNALLVSTYRHVAQATPTDEQLVDWLGELSNQLLGRIKEGMYLYNIELSLATPIVLRGLHLSVAGTNDVKHLGIEGATGHAVVMVDVSYASDLDLKRVDKATEEQRNAERNAALIF